MTRCMTCRSTGHSPVTIPGAVGEVHLLTRPATSEAAWDQAGAGRRCETVRPAMLEAQTPAS